MAELGPFRLEGALGEGGMGRVLGGVHQRSGLPVAIKTLPRSPSPDHVAAFHREAALVASLDHVHIVPVLDYGLAEPSTGLPSGTPYLVMPRATGTLDPLLTRLDWAQVRQVLCRLLDALAYAHARGVLHCDIKPSNVLVGVQRSERQPVPAPIGGLVLSDFGIARHGTTHRGPVGGTPGFMAPELEAGRLTQLGEWTDLWAVGALAWALLSGGPPREGHTLVSRTAVPPELEDWLHALLDPSPQRRFGRASEAADALPDGALGPASGALPPQPHAPEDTVPMLRPLTLPPTSSPPDLSPTGPATAAPSSFEVPADWRRERPPWPSQVLQDAGLGVWGLRAVPLVARTEARDQLWEALRLVADTGRPQLRFVAGPAQSGRSRMLAWIRQRAHEIGHAVTHAPTEAPWVPPHASARPCVLTFDEPAPSEEAAHAVAMSLQEASPTLLIVAVPQHAWPAPWHALRDRGATVELAPLHPSDLETLVRRALCLAPELVIPLARDADGSPGRALSTLGAWVEGDELVPTEHGFRRRSARPRSSARSAARDFDALRATAQAHLVHGRFRLAALATQRAEEVARELGIAEASRARRELDALALRLDGSSGATAHRRDLADQLIADAVEHQWWDLAAEAEMRRGITASNQGHPHQGRSDLEHAVHHADVAGDIRLQAVARLALGQVQLLLRDPPAATDTFDQIGDLSTGGAGVAVTNHHLGLAILARGTGASVDALRHASQALHVATAADLGFERVKALRIIGATLQRDQPAAAVEVWKQTIALARELGLTSDLPNAWSDLGLCLRRLGQLPEAERALQRAISLLAAEPEQTDAIARLNLAELYVATDRPHEAWALLAPEVLDIPTIGWASLRPQLWALRIAAAAARADRPQAEAALRGLNLEDPASLQADPSVRSGLSLAHEHCEAQGWSELVELLPAL